MDDGTSDDGTSEASSGASIETSYDVTVIGAGPVGRTVVERPASAG